MKALTIWQPYASLIVEGVKPYEFRTWPAHKSLIGQRIAIHAGARPIKLSEIGGLLDCLASSESWTAGLTEGAIPFLQKVKGNPEILPRSSILGTAILGRPVSASDILQDFGGPMMDLDREKSFKFAWPMLDIRRLEPPVPAKGGQGFWEWTP